MTQICAGPVLTGRVPVTMATWLVPGLVTLKVSGPVRVIPALLDQPAAQALTTEDGLSSQGWCPCSTEACAAQYRRQVVISQTPGNLGSCACVMSMTTRFGPVRVKAWNPVRPLRPTPKLRYPSKSPALLTCSNVGSKGASVLGPA